MKYFLFVLPLAIFTNLFLQVHYYEFALKRCNSTSDWSIHGLWPQYNVSSWPQFCHKFKFDVNKLDSIKPQLNRDWYSCYGSSTNYHFWKHEYLKHGTCSPYNESEYFKIGLRLFEEVKEKGYIDEFCQDNDFNCLIPYNLNLTIRR